MAAVSVGEIILAKSIVAPVVVLLTEVLEPLFPPFDVLAGVTVGPAGVGVGTTGTTFSLKSLIISTL